MTNKIIEQIEQNRISSVEVSDALGKDGVVNGVYPLNGGKFIVGEIFYVCGFDESNYNIHKEIENTPKGKIVFIDTFNCNNRAVIGDIVSKFLLLYKGAKGIIINGFARDIHRLKKENYPIWLKGVTPLGCFNEEKSLRSEVQEYIAKQKEIYDGAIAVCDDSGCVVIEKKDHNEDLIASLEKIELQEDIWYFCIDTLKKSTFETICEKTYENEDWIKNWKSKR